MFSSFLFFFLPKFINISLMEKFSLLFFSFVELSAALVSDEFDFSHVITYSRIRRKERFRVSIGWF